MGSTHSLLRVRHLTMAQGVFLPEAEADKELPVCVIGKKSPTSYLPGVRPSASGYALTTAAFGSSAFWPRRASR